MTAYAARMQGFSDARDSLAERTGLYTLEEQEAYSEGYRSGVRANFQDDIEAFKRGEL